MGASVDQVWPDLVLGGLCFVAGALVQRLANPLVVYAFAKPPRSKYDPPKQWDMFRRKHQHRFKINSHEMTNGVPWVVKVCQDPECQARQREPEQQA